jgi:hypothetical protein
MGIIDLFSKRQKRISGQVSDVYTYDKIPHNLKVQIVHIIRDSIGKRVHYGTDTPVELYKFIHDTLCREYGRLSLKEGYDQNYEEMLLNYFLHSNKTEEVLDLIELTFRCIEKVIKPDYDNYRFNADVKMTPDSAIEELNERFKESAIGYSFESGILIRIDSTYIHSEITKPTIILLQNDKFTGANEEYLIAHEHYREGRNKECLIECCKAFESVMKTICKEKGWTYAETDSSKKLVQICLYNNLIPSFTQDQFTSLQNLLVSGIATIRNKLGGHGQGQVPQKVYNEMARNGINLTGSKIIFLIEQSGLK